MSRFIAPQINIKAIDLHNPATNTNTPSPAQCSVTNSSATELDEEIIRLDTERDEKAYVINTIAALKKNLQLGLLEDYLSERRTLVQALEDVARQVPSMTPEGSPISIETTVGQYVIKNSRVLVGYDEDDIKLWATVTGQSLHRSYDQEIQKVKFLRFYDDNDLIAGFKELHRYHEAWKHLIGRKDDDKKTAMKETILTLLGGKNDEDALTPLGKKRQVDSAIAPDEESDSEPIKNKRRATGPKPKKADNSREEDTSWGGLHVEKVLRRNALRDEVEKLRVAFEHAVSKLNGLRQVHVQLQETEETLSAFVKKTSAMISLQNKNTAQIMGELRDNLATIKLNEEPFRYTKLDLDMHALPPPKD